MMNHDPGIFPNHLIHCLKDQINHKMYTICYHNSYMVYGPSNPLKDHLVLKVQNQRKEQLEAGAQNWGHGPHLRCRNPRFPLSGTRPPIVPSSNPTLAQRWPIWRQAATGRLWHERRLEARPFLSLRHSRRSGLHFGINRNLLASCSTRLQGNAPCRFSQDAIQTRRHPCIKAVLCRFDSETFRNGSFQKQGALTETLNCRVLIAGTPTKRTPDLQKQPIGLSLVRAEVRRDLSHSNISILAPFFKRRRKGAWRQRHLLDSEVCIND